MIFVEKYTFYVIINNVFKQITKQTRTDAPRRYAVWNAPRSIQKGICIFLEDAERPRLHSYARA